MNIKIIFFIFVFVSNIFALNFNFNALSQKDKETLKIIKEYGKKHGLSYSLMAIAIKESSLGRFVINVDSMDYGIYQANIKTVIQRHNAKDTSWNRNKFAMRLVSDFEFATNNAIAELTYWRKIHNNDWRKVWSSYNGGWKYDSKRARKYSQDIAKIIRELKKVNV